MVLERCWVRWQREGWKFCQTYFYYYNFNQAASGIWLWVFSYDSTGIWVFWYDRKCCWKWVNRKLISTATSCPEKVLEKFDALLVFLDSPWYRRLLHDAYCTNCTVQIHYFDASRCVSANHVGSFYMWNWKLGTCKLSPRNEVYYCF